MEALLLLLWKPVLGSVAIAIGSWLGRKFVKSSDDKNRAEIISRIADEALSLVILNNPSKWEYADLVRLLLDRLVDAIPTANKDVLQRAAAAAVERRVNRKRFPVE